MVRRKKYTERILLHLSPEMKAALEVHAREKQLKTTAEGIRQLIALGFAASHAGLADILQDGSKEELERLRAALKGVER